jgi:hypothetical protein
MSPGDRVVITAGPWPERVGCHGTIVTGPDVYPFHGVARHECVILLDADPLRTDPTPERPFAGSVYNDIWSCVISKAHLALELCPWTMLLDTDDQPRLHCTLPSGHIGQPHQWESRT